MPSSSEDTAQLSGTACWVSDARGHSQADTDTANISFPPPTSASAPAYGTFDPQPRNEDRPRKQSCLKSSLEACFKIFLNRGDGDGDDDDDDDDSFSSYSLSTQQSEGSSTPHPSSLSSEDQSSASEATLDEIRPRKDLLGYKSVPPMQSSRNGAP